MNVATSSDEPCDELCLPVTPATSRSTTELLPRIGRGGQPRGEAKKPVETLIQPGKGSGMAPDQRILGRYRLLERLGSGGFGEVWRAHDELLHREVALKRILSGDGERAAREAKATARLSHPAIVALYEVAYEGGVCHLVSELVEGATLATLIAEDALADAEILEIGVALCDALGHAHARGVIHRDVKPHNVLVPDEPHDRGPAAKLTDFGGALLDGEQALTRTGDVLGTLAYMSPEQSEGREAGPAADLYSLALVLYEALSGENPVRAATPAATVRRIGTRLPPLRKLRRDLPRDLTGTIDRALHPLPEQRGSVAALAAALAAESEVEPTEPRDDPYEDDPGNAETELLGERTALTAMRRLPAAPAAHARQEWPAHDEGRPEPSAARDGRREESRMAPSGGRGREPWTAAPDDRRAVSARGRLALPRILWVLGALALIVAQLAAGRVGSALIVLAAALPLLVAMPRRAGPVWLLPACAPVLGLVGLAAAFPALAGELRSRRQRIAFGALGYWWLSLAELWLGRSMPPGALFASSSGASASLAHHAGSTAAVLPQLRAPSSFEASLSGGWHALSGLVSLPLLAAIALWAAGTLLLPLLVRGEALGNDLSRVALWSVAMLFGPALLAALLRPGAVSPLSAAVGSGAPIAGATLGVLIALGCAALRPSPADPYRGGAATSLRA